MTASDITVPAIASLPAPSNRRGALAAWEARQAGHSDDEIIEAMQQWWGWHAGKAGGACAAADAQAARWQHEERLEERRQRQDIKKAIRRDRRQMALMYGVPVRGDTYPAREALRAIGCHWDSCRRCWMAPDQECAALARDIVELRASATTDAAVRAAGQDLAR